MDNVQKFCYFLDTKFVQHFGWYFVGSCGLAFFIFLRVFLNSPSRIWGPSSLVTGGGSLSSWYSSVMYYDHLLRMSSFSIKMSPSFDRMHPVFAVALSPMTSFIFWCKVLLFTPLLASISSHCVFLCFIVPLFSLVCLVLCISVCLPWLFFALPLSLKFLGSSIFCLPFVFFTGMCSFADSYMLSFII